MILEKGLELRPTSDGNERNEEVGRVSGNKMGESGGEDIGSVTDGAATLVDEFQLLQQTTTTTKS